MELGALVAGMDVRPVAGASRAGWERVRICDLTEDSRTVVPGSLFLARSGFKSDGKAYIEAAVRAGAVAVLSDRDTDQPEVGVPVLYAHDVARVSALMGERFYGNPSSKLDLIAVTGTNGKTTTTWLAWQILNAVGRRAGLIGTVVIDDGAEVAPAMMTTPPSIEISRTLARMVECGCTAAVFEASSHALHQKRVDALHIDVSVFTNLTGDHLDYHKTMEHYAACKARLFEMLQPDGMAIVNAHDPATATMIRNCEAPVIHCEMVREGAAWLSSGNQAHVRITSEALAGMTLRLGGPWGEIEACVPLIGRYNAMNVLQAAAACHAIGVSAAELERGLRKVSAPAGRLQPVHDERDDLAVYVDFAHSDDALRNVLSEVGAVMPNRAGRAGQVHDAAGAASRAERGGRLWVVFGCGGDKDRTKRPRMGKVAGELADVVVLTSDNPRTERPSDIVDEILGGISGEARHKVLVQVDREKAIEMAIAQAQAGDVIVLAGKGHETDQILPTGKVGPDGAKETMKIHFDDREVASKYLAMRRAGASVVVKASSERRTSTT
jgi:UDP-N-acetylmuramoyl-L-alanyl-D-glutamate--2,6-diaminopimelate ligase